MARGFSYGYGVFHEAYGWISDAYGGFLMVTGFFCIVTLDLAQQYAVSSRNV
jgi:ABC-type Zn2+ transport system substrate-binding protein/surface adhesin